MHVKMNIECPKCKDDQPLKRDDLPMTSSKKQSYECKNCNHKFNIGWHAVADVR